MSWYYDFPRFPKSKPREAKGGIKAQNQRGSFGNTWWARQWNAVLESFHIGSRLARGRSYARRGQVLSIDIVEGKVTARVQGSRPTPYVVSIAVTPLTDADWQQLAAVLSKQAIFTAKLLAGEMPQDIEEAFRAAKLSLFPKNIRELKTSCSCPDYSNPCKHIAAVYYLLGEEFDRDPFLIFKLRGKERGEFLKLLSKRAPTGSPAPEEIEQPVRRKRSTAPARPVRPAKRKPEPLPSDRDAFWSGGEVADNLFSELRPAAYNAALPRRLGSFPFWRGDERFLDALDEIYSAASRSGIDTFVGEEERRSRE